jgi:hypothetical protein
MIRDFIVMILNFEHQVERTISQVKDITDGLMTIFHLSSMRKKEVKTKAHTELVQSFCRSPKQVFS